MNVQRTLTLPCILVVPLLGMGADSVQAKDPRVATYAALIPGGGQVYNGRFIKALAVVALEGLAIGSWLQNSDLYDSYDPDDDTGFPLRKHRYLEKRNKYAWWVGFIYVYGMIDALVDAHLSPFTEVMGSSMGSEPKNGEENE